MEITKVWARQILDSRGNPTIEVDVTLSDGSFGRAAVPSGASTGIHEALELRDGDRKLYEGKSVLKTVRNVTTTIAQALNGMSIANQRAFDQRLIELDGTPNKARLGANAILGVSMAACRARAVSEKRPLWQSLAEQFGVKLGENVLLPAPMMNVINGGKHADSGLAIQECMIVPVGFISFSEALRASAETFHNLKNLIHKAGYNTTVGDEGGFAPAVKNTQEAFDLILNAIEKAGYTDQIKLAIDPAASSFYDNGKYVVDGQELTTEELVSFYEAMCQKYPLVSIEDSHAEDDWKGFELMHQALGDHIQLVGDDLLVTNTERIKMAIEKQAVNAVLIKPNQIGTVSETVAAIQLTQKQGWKTVVSHRSGETEDAFIAHLAVGLQTGQIKTGSLSRGERIGKYNELLRIEEELGGRAVYADSIIAH